MAVAERVAVQRRLQVDPGRLATDLVAAVQAGIPAYASLSEAQQRETRAIAAWAVGRLIEMWIDDGSLTEADRRRFHGIGVARATDGRPLLAVLRAYSVAAVVACDLIVRTGAGSLDVDDVIVLNRTTLMALEDLSEALFTGYTTTMQRLADDREASLAGLTQDLLTGRHVSAPALRDRASQLGMPIPLDVSVLVVRAGSGEISAGEVADLASIAHDQLRLAPDAPLLQTRNDGLGVLLLPEPTQLTGELAARGWTGCRIDHADPSDIPEAFRLAVTAVRTAPRGAFTARNPLLRADALYLAVLRGEPPVDPRHLVDAILGPLLQPRHRHVLEGVQGWFDHGSATEAATALSLHPQTMRHRLKRAAQLTGLDPTSSWDGLLLHTALTARAGDPATETRRRPSRGAPGDPPARHPFA